MKKQSKRTEIKSSRQGNDFNLNDSQNELVAIGPFYTYVFDRSNQTISQLSPSFETLHGISRQFIASAKEYEILVHPDDLVLESNFYIQANTQLAELDPAKISRYKLSYNLRLWTADQTYKPFNIQCIVSKNNNTKSLIICTLINHLCTFPNKTYSLLGLQNEASFLNISPKTEPIAYSQRELEVARLLAEGNTCPEIAVILNISNHTVISHRKNVLAKSKCRTIAELIRKLTLDGIV